MTSKDSKDQKPQELWPIPLSARNGDLGRAVRAYADSTAESNGEESNYANVMASLDGSSRRVPRFMLGASALVLAAAAVLIVVRAQDVSPTAKVVAARPSIATSGQHSVLSVKAPAAGPSRAEPVLAAPTAAGSSRTEAATPSVKLGDRLLPLPTGEIEIEGQARAILFADATASAIARHGASEITLERGRIELQVLPRTPEHPLSVTAGRYRFTVVGTVFTVSRSPARVELAVREGAVAVSRGTRQIAVVTAGGSWSSDVRAPSLLPPIPTAEAPRTPPENAYEPPESALEPPAPGLSPPPHAVVADPPVAAPRPDTSTDRDCRQLLASRRTQEAVVCYERQAARPGLAGETATYDLARLWRDTLGKPQQALAAFESLRSRFPHGVLRREAALSIIELLPRVGRHADALTESLRFLAAYHDDERKGEIYLLRGNIYREVFHDLNKAQSEYAMAAGFKGSVGDDSRFLHAVCLEALGRVDEARRAYQAYLRQHGSAHAAEAEKRLAGLTR